MKNWIRTGIALFAFMGLTASAAGATCVPVPPADFKGHLGLLHPGESVAATFFEQNGCNWNGLDQLNGTDGLVIDITGAAGPASLTAVSTPTTLVLVVVQGHFLDANCAPIGGSDFHTTSTTPASPLAQLVTVPATAKWMVIDSTDTNAGNDYDISLHTDGVDCPVVKKKKKKR